MTALKKLNVPYLVSLPLVFQTTEEWLDSELGVHPVQVALQVHSQQEMRPSTPWKFMMDILGKAKMPLKACQEHLIEHLYPASEHRY